MTAAGAGSCAVSCCCGCSDVFSESYPTHAEALRAARTAAAEQMQPGHTEVIEYEDEKGHWHVETAPGRDRPETAVEDSE